MQSLSLSVSLSTERQTDRKTGRQTDGRAGGRAGRQAGSGQDIPGGSQRVWSGGLLEALGVLTSFRRENANLCM